MGRARRPKGENTSQNLAYDWQAENKAAAEAALSAVLSSQNEEEAASKVHDAWLERNRDRAEEHQKVPYADLSEEEKEKDRVQVREALEHSKNVGFKAAESEPENISSASDRIRWMTTRGEMSEEEARAALREEGHIDADRLRWMTTRGGMSREEALRELRAENIIQSEKVRNEPEDILASALYFSQKSNRKAEEIKTAGWDMGGGHYSWAWQRRVEQETRLIEKLEQAQANATDKQTASDIKKALRAMKKRARSYQKEKAKALRAEEAKERAKYNYPRF